MDIVLNTECFGYTDNTGGYSGTFSWWRRDDKPGWFVCGHIHGFTESTAFGVTDDFGNIVKVKQ